MLLGTGIMLFWMPKLCRPIQMTGDNGYISEQKREKIGIIYAKASGEWPKLGGWLILGTFQPFVAVSAVCCSRIYRAFLYIT